MFEHEIKHNNQSECKQHKTINHHHHPLESHNYFAINCDSIKIFFISINYHQTLLNDPPSASTRTTYRNLQQQRWNYIYAFIRRSYIIWGEKNTHDHVKMFAKDKIIIIIIKKPNGLLVLGSNWHNRRRRGDGQQQQLPCSFNNIVAAHDRHAVDPPLPFVKAHNYLIRNSSIVLLLSLLVFNAAAAINAHHPGRVTAPRHSRWGDSRSNMSIGGGRWGEEKRKEESNKKTAGALIMGKRKWNAHTIYRRLLRAM